MDTTAILEQREANDAFFASDHHSPLDEKVQETFSGLRCYETNPGLVYRLPVEPVTAPRSESRPPMAMSEPIGEPATVTREVNEETAVLNLYSTGHAGYFVPFRETSGTAGRYLHIQTNHDGTVTVDFNQAYNPYCAYNDAYSCPLPPVK